VRRRLPINGLFYDIATFSILDYVGGVDDLEQRVVRTIGDPGSASARTRPDDAACEFAREARAST